MKKALFTVLCLAMVMVAGNLWANSSALVTNPADMRFIELDDIARFLEEDLDLGKGVTEVIGKKVIDHRFRKAGIPDPVKESLAYSMVVREMPVDQLNVAFVLKGNIDSGKFLDFSDKRYYRYFGTLQKKNIEAKPRIPSNITINEKPTRVYPFAFRNAEALVTYFGEYTIVATVPKGNYSLVSEIINVLDGKAPMTKSQPAKISFVTSFIPNAQEREEISKFEGQYEGFVAKARAGFKKVVSKKAYAGEQRMTNLENSLKNSMARVEHFTYFVEANKQSDGYGYDISMSFKCANEQEAARLKDMLLAWMASSSAKAMSEQDLVSLKANRVSVNKENCNFFIKLGSSQAEQYQFSSMIMTLMMQDRRFNNLLKN